MKNILQDTFANWIKDYGEDFSGVFSVSNVDGVIFQQACGYRNKAEELPNTAETAFGIASGTKLFTGLAVCKLIDEGKLFFEDKLCELLSVDLGQIDKRVTVFHLLTHTSGVCDYLDGESEDNEECEEYEQSLLDKYPVYLWTRLEYYLQMITPLRPKFEPGERYYYSNSDYILLGLVVEAVSGISYQQFVHDNIIAVCNLTHTGFYRMDSLPPNTALGYMQDEDTQAWRTNIFSVPVIGGSDGGLFTCAKDMDKLWNAIISAKILSKDMTDTFLKAHIVDACSPMTRDDGGSVESIGLGMRFYTKDGKTAYFRAGSDFGVGFFTSYYPKTGIFMSYFSNTGWMGHPGNFYLMDRFLDID